MCVRTVADMHGSTHSVNGPLILKYNDIILRPWLFIIAS